MKYIKLVLVSSVAGFETQQREWAVFISKINEICAEDEICFDLTICTDLSRSVLKKWKQSRYNTKICGSQYFFVLVGESIGEYMKEEIDVALQSRRETGSPCICGYTMGLSERGKAEPLVDDFMKLLEKETGRGAIAVPHVDSVKLYMLLELVKAGAIPGQLRLKDGCAVLNGKAVLSLENVPIYSKNQFVEKLIKEKERLDRELGELPLLQTIQTKEKRAELMERRELTDRFLREQEMDVLKLCHRTMDRDGYGLLPFWREKKAMTLVNQGDYESAMAVLRDPQWDEELQYAEEAAQADLGFIWGYILGKAALIDTIKATGTDEKAMQEIDTLYQKVAALAVKHQVGMLVMYDYLEFLDSQDRFEECVDAATKLRDYETQKGFSEENLARTTSILADFLLKVERLDEAVEMYREVLDIYMKLAKKDLDTYYPHVAKASYNLAYALNENRRPDAEEWYCHALGAYRQLTKANPEEYYPHVAKISVKLAFMCFETGRMEKAKGYLSYALAIYTKLGMEKDRDNVLKILNQLP